MRKNIKKLLSTILTVFFVAMMVVTAGMPKTVLAQDTVTEYSYFVIEKEWKNDIESERPESINVHVLGSDESNRTYELSASNNWKQELKLPAKSGSTEITYTAYEETGGLSKYSSNATITQPIRITKKATIKENAHTGDGYIVNNSGLDKVPEGNVVLSRVLKLEDATRTYYDKDGNADNTNFQFGVYRVYGNTSDITNQNPRIIYTGTLNEGENNIGSVSLVWDNKGTNSITGEKYKLSVTLSNIVIYSLVKIEANDDRYVAIMANIGGSDLNMQAYVGPNFDANMKRNIVGVKADINIQVLDSDNNPVSGYTKFLVDDIDMPDYANFYKDGAADINGYFGLNHPYAESVELTKGVSSDIYLNNPTELISNTPTNGKFTAGTNPGDDSAKTSLVYLADTSSFSFTWKGSNCGTMIIAGGADPVIPDTTTKISNISSKYVVWYYYQKEGETEPYYATDPDFKGTEVMIAPGTNVAVTEDDKTPDGSRGKPATGNFILDEDKNTEWTGTTSAEEAKNPLVLKVYFKKTYTVIYHDNVEDKVWNKDTQTTTDIVYGTETPAFNGTPSRPGYTFDGWSETSDGPILESLPATVKKDADYWAHWTPRTDTKYKVQYYYEVNGSYPATPDFTSADRTGTTDQTVSIIESDKNPAPSKPDYYLNSNMTSEWTGIVAGDGSLILKVYFKEKAKPVSVTYKAPVTGVE